MENAADRTAEMIEQAKAALAAARFQEMLAQKTAKVVAGTLALGLREQGLSDTAIGEVLGVSRNRVSNLVDVGVWPRVAGDVPLFQCEERDAIEAGVSTLCKPLVAQETGWIHTRTGRGQDLLEENKVPLPYAIGKRPGLLDAEAAQFDNQSSGERILVYTLSVITAKCSTTQICARTAPTVWVTTALHCARRPATAKSCRWNCWALISALYVSAVNGRTLGTATTSAMRSATRSPRCVATTEFGRYRRTWRTSPDVGTPDAPRGCHSIRDGPGTGAERRGW